MWGGRDPWCSAHLCPQGQRPLRRLPHPAGPGTLPHARSVPARRRGELAGVWGLPLSFLRFGGRCSAGLGSAAAGASTHLLRKASCRPARRPCLRVGAAGAGRDGRLSAWPGARVPALWAPGRATCWERGPEGQPDQHPPFWVTPVLLGQALAPEAPGRCGARLVLGGSPSLSDVRPQTLPARKAGGGLPRPLCWAAGEGRHGRPSSGLGPAVWGPRAFPWSPGPDSPQGAGL